MKIGVVFIGTVISAASKPYTMDNGKTGISYNLCVEVGGEADNLPCDEYIFKAVESGNIAKYSQCTFTGEYDSRYKRLRVINYKQK